MIKIQIKKSGTISNEATFSSRVEADKWLAEHEEMQTFGRPAYSYEQQVETVPVVLAEDGTEISPSQYETQTVNVPAEYTVVIEDITEKLSQERSNNNAQSFLDSTDWKVLRHRDQQELGIATSLTGEEFQELLRQRQMAREVIIK